MGQPKRTRLAIAAGVAFTVLSGCAAATSNTNVSNGWLADTQARISQNVEQRLQGVDVQAERYKNFMGGVEATPKNTAEEVRLQRERVERISQELKAPFMKRCEQMGLTVCAQMLEKMTVVMDEHKGKDAQQQYGAWAHFVDYDEGKALYKTEVRVGMGLAKDLNDGELAVILGHEMGHVLQGNAIAATNERKDQTLQNELFQYLKGDQGIGYTKESQWVEGWADRFGQLTARDAGYEAGSASSMLVKMGGWKRASEKTGQASFALGALSVKGDMNYPGDAARVAMADRMKKELDSGKGPVKVHVAQGKEIELPSRSGATQGGKTVKQQQVQTQNQGFGMDGR